jgi:hypothetical protein
MKHKYMMMFYERWFVVEDEEHDLRTGTGKYCKLFLAVFHLATILPALFL